MPNHGTDGTIADCENQTKDVSDLVEKEKVASVVLVPEAPARSASITPLVGSDDMKSRFGEGGHHVPPAVRQLRESMEEHDARSPVSAEACLQHMHPQPVAIVDEARTDTSRENRRIVGSDLGDVRCCWFLGPFCNGARLRHEDSRCKHRDETVHHFTTCQPMTFA